METLLERTGGREASRENEGQEDMMLGHWVGAAARERRRPDDQV